MNQHSSQTDTVPPNSTLAVVSLVSGILGLTFVPGIASLVAIVTGYMAMKEIQESRGRLGGEGMARIGLILGWIAVGLAIIGVCCFLIALAFPVVLTFLGLAVEGTGLLPETFHLIV